MSESIEQRIGALLIEAVRLAAEAAEAAPNADIQLRGIHQAIALAGTQKVLAARLGVTQQIVSQWARRGFVPIKHAHVLKAMFGVALIDLIDPRIAAEIAKEAA